MKKTTYRLSDDEDCNRHIDIFQDGSEVSCYDLNKKEDRLELVEDLNRLQAFSDNINFPQKEKSKWKEPNNLKTTKGITSWM
jgi:hypothetical protein